VRRISGFLLGALLIAPSVARAQSNSAYQPSRPAIVALQPSALSAPVWSVRGADTDRAVAHREFSSRAPGGALMILGGAALLAGLLTDGSGSTALIVGGIGVGAYGVYLYTQ